MASQAGTQYRHDLHIELHVVPDNAISAGSLGCEPVENSDWIHAFWSTDWFTDAAKEGGRLRKAIEDRLEVLKGHEVKAATTLLDPPTGLAGDVGLDQELPLDETEPAADAPKVINPPVVTQSYEKSVEIGDTVRVVYLDGDRAPLEVTLSNTRNAPDLGIVHVTEPLGWALYGAEEGDEIEVLVGNSVRMARIETVTKNGNGTPAPKPSPRTPTPAVSPPAGVPVGDLFGAKSAPQVAVNVSLDPARFYEPGYLRTLTALTCDLVDRFGPMTFRHLSELVARAHGFQRTGSQIKSQVWSVISKSRRHSRDGKGGESTIWPKGVDPVQVIPFRGMIVGGEQREWPYVPYPEKLGLAIEIRAKSRGDDLAGQMASRIGLARLKQTTRAELEELLKDAQGAEREV